MANHSAPLFFCIKNTGCNPCEGLQPAYHADGRQHAPLKKRLFFFTIREVACIAQARHNVRVLVQIGVDGCTPDGSLVLGKN